MCPHTCPVLQGGKKYEDMDWYMELSEDDEQRLNAALNEEEYIPVDTSLSIKIERRYLNEKSSGIRR